jgi:hypothetical protein
MLLGGDFKMSNRMVTKILPMRDLKGPQKKKKKRYYQYGFQIGLLHLHSRKISFKEK